MKTVVDHIKRVKGCRDCGERDVSLLQFHHRNPSEKAFTVSHLRCGWRPLWAEIAKCDVLCKLCHYGCPPMMSKGGHQLLHAAAMAAGQSDREFMVQAALEKAATLLSDVVMGQVVNGA